MIPKRLSLAVLILCMIAFAQAQGAPRWHLDLPESVTVDSIPVRLADITSSPLPAVADRIVILGQGKPGTMVTLSRQIILRKLVEAGAAAGVIFQGAAETQVVFEGKEVSSETLREDLMSAIQPLVPAARSGAPDSWFDLTIPETKLALSGKAEITVQRSRPLEPGRNQLSVRLQTSRGHQDIPVMVTLHSFAEVPSARMAIQREAPLNEGQFSWSWLDLAEIQGQPVTGREALAGACAGRSLAAGDRLRIHDLKAIPAIKAGDMVDLQIQRGGLMVTVRAMARQAGCLGQIIPVRNEMNGRLVNARVLGSGSVEWRR